jgi:hypothetical protein
MKTIGGKFIGLGMELGLILYLILYIATPTTGIREELHGMRYGIVGWMLIVTWRTLLRYTMRN